MKIMLRLVPRRQRKQGKERMHRTRDNVVGEGFCEEGTFDYRLDELMESTRPCA